MNLGISVDGARARAVLMEHGGEIAARAESTASDVARAIGNAAREALAGVNGSRPSAAGVSFIDPDPRQWPSDLAALTSAIGTAAPVRKLSNGNASALAEAQFGSAKGARHLIAFSIGPYVSAGVISNGALLSGAHGLATSAQWLALNPVEREDYRRTGCLEAEGGEAGIVRRFVWRIRSGDKSRVVDAAGGDLNTITLNQILRGAHDNDGLAVSVVRDTVRYVAMALSNMAAVIDPEVIVLGGILQSSADLLLEPIRQECARRMPPAIFAKVRIEVSTLGPDSAPMGAAYFAGSGSTMP